MDGCQTDLHLRQKEVDGFLSVLRTATFAPVHGCLNFMALQPPNTNTLLAPSIPL